MSVLIKGMEMPTSCAECELAEHYERYELEHYCPFTGWYADYEKCPLVPVPPHGRLIDADELAATCDEPHWCAWLSDIDNAPTIIPAEEGECCD